MCGRVRWPVVRASRCLAPLILVLALTGCDSEPVPVIPAEPLESPQILERIARPVEGARVHLVRLVQRGDQYAFDPAVIHASAGDVVRFVMAGTQPESVAFDPTNASPEAADFIRARFLHHGVLLTDSGQAYDVSFADAPPGRYPFVSVPHAIHGMVGEVLIEE